MREELVNMHNGTILIVAAVLFPVAVRLLMFLEQSLQEKSKNKHNLSTGHQ
jgi:hypothetical protein